MTNINGQEIGNYKIIKQIGVGGFAEVYLGEHIHLGTQAALKILHARLADPQEIEHFRKEARIVAQLQHPNIIRVLDYQIQDNTPFFVMDLAPYGSLRDRYKRGEQVPFEKVITYTYQVASALQFAHMHKCVHRDIKPGNMLIGHHQEILVSDFGIAVVAQSTHIPTTQDMAGTVPYMAPEQIQAHPCPASDQYSLAITVYEWLTGRRPFEGTFTEIAVKQTSVPPPPPSQFTPIAPGTEQVILKALEKSPEQRFPDVSAFAAALECSRHSYAIASSHRMASCDEKTLYAPESAQNPRSVEIAHATSAVDTTHLPLSTRQVPAMSLEYLCGPSRTRQDDMPPAVFKNPYALSPNGAFPLLRRKPSKSDVLWIGLYAALGWVLFTMLGLYAPTQAAASANTLQVGLSLTGLFLWYFLSGSLLGSWRSLLALLAGSAIVFLYVNTAVTHGTLAVSEMLSYGLLSLIGALIGLGYELRKEQYKLHSFFIFALGIYLFFIITEFIGGTHEVATHIPELLIITCCSPLLAIVPLLGELLIRGIVKLVSRFEQVKSVA